MLSGPGAFDESRQSITLRNAHMSGVESDGTHRCDIYRPGVTRGQKVVASCVEFETNTAEAVGFVLSRESYSAVGSGERGNAC